MIAIDLLSEIVPAINKNDKALEALNWMDVFKVSHLPIVDNGEYLGIISDADIFDMNDPEAPLYMQCPTLKRPYVKEDQHIYDIALQVSKQKLSTIPVLDQNDIYIGLIRVIDLTQQFSKLMSAESPGGVIILELNTNDYSLSEIAQIVESNDTKILSFYVQNHKELDKLEITFKVNRTDLSAVIQTFERYSYQIKSVFSESKEMDSLLQDRIDSLLRFMDI